MSSVNLKRQKELNAEVSQVMDDFDRFEYGFVTHWKKIVAAAVLVVVVVTVAVSAKKRPKKRAASRKFPSGSSAASACFNKIQVQLAICWKRRKSAVLHVRAAAGGKLWTTRCRQSGTAG